MTDNVVKIYTKDGCVQCSAVIRSTKPADPKPGVPDHRQKPGVALAQAQVPVETVNVMADEAAMERVLASGSRQMPYVEWSIGSETGSFHGNNVTALAQVNAAAQTLTRDHANL